MKKLIKVLLAVILAFSAGCSGSSSGGGEDTNARVTFSLMDAPSNSYKAVYVSVEKVEVQKTVSGQEGSWITVTTPKKTYNLLELVNGAKSLLGNYELENGTYGQIRLLLSENPDTGRNILGQTHPYANYVIDSQSQSHKLKVPSGYQSGIKITGGFAVSGTDFEILLDFDASSSVVQAGNSGQWLLKPVIKSVISTASGRISGTVKDSSGNPIDDVMVYLQKPGTTFPEVVAAAKTDDDGKYAIEAQAGTYIVVASGEDHSPACESITIPQGGSLTKNFSMQSSPNGEISGSLSITSLSQEASVTAHFLRNSPCTGTTMIEVAALNIANNSETEITLPEGSYYVYFVNPETGATGSLEPFTVVAGMDMNFEIAF